MFVPTAPILNNTVLYFRLYILIGYDILILLGQLFPDKAYHMIFCCFVRQITHCSAVTPGI